MPLRGEVCSGSSTNKGRGTKWPMPAIVLEVVDAKTSIADMVPACMELKA